MVLVIGVMLLHTLHEYFLPETFYYVLAYNSMNYHKKQTGKLFPEKGIKHLKSTSDLM